MIEPIFHSNGDFYKYVDGTIAEMRNAGLSKEADRLDALLHKVAWKTRDELFSELGLSIQSILGLPNLAVPARSMLRNCVAAMRT